MNTKDPKLIDMLQSTSLTQNHSVAKAIAVNPNSQATSLLRRRAQLLILLIAMMMSGMKGWGQAGFFTSPTGSVISYSVNGTPTSNRCYGDIVLAGSTNTFSITGFRGFTFKGGSGNVCSVQLHYRIYRQGNASGSFTTATANSFATTFSQTTSCGTVSNGSSGDQMISNTTATINVMSSVTSPGTWVLEYFFSATGSTSSSSACNSEAFFNNNSGSNRTITFTVTQNPGFESSSTTADGWISDPSSQGNISNSINTVTRRSGSRSLYSNVTTGNARTLTRHSGYVVAVPSSSTNYVHVLGWVRAETAADQARVNAFSPSGGTAITGTLSNTTNGSWVRFTASGIATNGGVYVPEFAVDGDQTLGGGDFYYLDDIIIYTTQGTTVTSADLTKPNAPTGLTVTRTSTGNNLSWTDGTDNATQTSGISGTLILRCSTNVTGSLSALNSALLDQAFYSTTSNLGPTTISDGTNTWTVVSNGTSSGSYTDAGASTNVTYVVVMRDNAYNYSAGVAAFSNCVNPTSGGTVSAAQDICLGGDPANITSLTLPGGSTGTLGYKWQSSTTSSSTGFSDISGATSTDYNPPSPVNQTTWYKRLSKVGCHTDWVAAGETAATQVSVDQSNALATWPNSQNDQVTGLNAWTLSTSGSPAGHFVGSSGSDINVNSRSWGLFASSGGESNAIRPLTSNMSIGSTLNFSIDNSSVQSGGVAGFSLRNSANAALMEFYFTGGASFYTINDNAGASLTTVPFTSSGLDISISYTAADTYAMSVKPRSGSTTYYFTGRTFISRGNQVPREIRFFNFNAGSGDAFNYFVNSISLNRAAIGAETNFSAQTICSGATPNKLSVTAYGTGLSYQWFSATNAAGTTGVTNLGTSNGAQTFELTPQNSSAGTLYYYCVVSSSCGSVTSNVSGAVTVASSNAVSVSIASSDADSTICSGESVTFTATPTNGGTSPSYQWKLNGANVGTNSATYTTTTLANNDAVSVVMTSNATCPTGSPATSNSITTTVNANNAASVSIASSDADNIICSGTSVTFTATPTNGGASPSYQWKVGSTNVGTNSNTYTTTSLANNDAVSVVMTSNATCPTGSPATSNSISTTVNANNAVSVSIASSDADNIICSGTSVTFTATPTNGGASPSYQWKLNGGNVGTNSATYTTTSLANNDAVTVVLTSNATCATGSPATSNSITTTVNANNAVSVSIVSSDADNTVCAGTSVTFTATPTNGGASPSYQWKLNGVNVGTNSATYTNTSLANNDAVSVVLTSNATCATGSPATSNTINTAVITSTTSIAPSGTQNITLGANGTQLTVTEGTNTVTSRQWGYRTVSGTGTITDISGETAATYTPNFASAGTYYVVCRTTYGSPCSTTITSNEVQINVTGLSITTGTVSGSPFCVGATGITVPFTYATAGNFPSGTTTFTAQLSNASGSFASPVTLQSVASNASGSQSISVTIPSNTAAGSGYRIRVVSNSPAVDGSDNGFNLTVNVNTVGAASSTPTLCINTALTNITHTTTGATGIGTATGLPTGVTAGWSSNTITISGTPSVAGTFNYSIPLTGGCGSVNATGTITVTAANTAGAASSTPTLCVNTAFADITHTTTGATGIGTASGLPAGVTANWASNTITISGTPTASGTYNYTIPLSGGCGSVNATGTITVTAVNTAGAASSTPTLCVNTALTNITHTTTGATGIGSASGLPAGVTAGWASNTITISGTPTASGTYNYTIPLSGGCGSVNATGTITVTAANTVGAASSTPTLCINTALTNITHSTTGATGIGSATGLPTGVTAGWASNTITISGTPTASGTYNYTIPLSGGCGSVNATGTITVTAVNTAGAASSTPTLCVNTALTNITHTTTGATGIGSASGLPAGVTAGWASNTITISGTPTVTGTYNYTIPLSGGCSSVNATGTITVNSSVGGTAAAASSSVCLNGSTSISLSGQTGATIQWQRSEDAGTTWSNISGATSTSYTTPNLITATSYRAVVTNSSCASANSTTATVSISEANTSTAGASTYNSSWSNGANDGVTGLGAWSLSPSSNGANSGFYISSASNVDVKNANTRAWALYGKNGETASAVRSISMSVGNTVSFSMDNGGINGTIGAAIQNANGDNLMEFIFIGGQSFYRILDNAGSNLTSIGYTTGGLDISITYTAENTYSLFVTGKGGATTSFPSRTFSAPSSGRIPAQIRFFNFNAGDGGSFDLFFNSLSISNPIISSHPSTGTQTVCQNGSATALSVTASGTGVTYQWYSNTTASNSGGTLIDGATSSSYTPSTTSASALYYYCVVSNSSCGSATSRVSGLITVTATNTAGTASSTPTLCINTALTNITHTTTGATGIGSATGLPAGVTANWSSNTITISGTPTASGTFSYSIPLTGGCGTVNATGTITVTAANTAGTASSTPTLCVNTALTNITHSTTGATGIGTATGLPAGVTANWSSNQITISGTPTAAGTFSYSIPLTGGCGSVNATGTITVTNPGVWVGGTSTDWNTAANWTCGVPTSTTDVTIPSGTTFSPSITSANANCKNITINSGATLSMANSYTLTVASGSTFTNHGTFTRGNGTVVFAGSGTIAGTVTFNNLTLNGPVTFGTAVTIDGTLQLNSSSSIETNSPIYTSNSTLTYNTTGTYGRIREWSATGAGTIGTTPGYPNNVTITNNTTLNYPNGAPTVARALEGTLTINSGSVLNMAQGSPSTSAALTVKGSVVNNGTLTLGDAAGGNLNVGGNFTSAGTFNANSRTVTFNGTSGQNINSAVTFAGLTVSNSSGVTLGAAVTVSGTLDLTGGSITLGANNLTASGTISGASSTNHIVTNGNGYLIRNVSSSEVTFPVGTGSSYAPAYLTQAGTAENISVRVKGSIDNAVANNTNAVVNLQWTLNEATAGSNNLTTKFQWNGSNEGSAFARSSTVEIGQWSTSYTRTAASVSGSDPYIASSSSGITANISATPFIVANDFAFTSVPVQYRSRQTGNWNDFNTWERSTNSGATWSNAISGQTPSSSDGAITIRDQHTVTIIAAVTIDEVTVNTGGTVIHSTTSNVVLANGTGTDLTINGIWRNTSSASGTIIDRSSGGTIIVGSGGAYEHQLSVSGGSVPTATWHNNSILRIKNNATGNSTIGNLSQTFGIVEYDRSAQTSTTQDISFGDVTNELRIISTGSGAIRFNADMTLAGSYLQSGGTVSVRSDIGTGSLTIGGTFTLEAGNFYIANGNGSSNSVTVTVNGNCTLSGGVLRFSATSSASGPGFLRLKGDLNLTGVAFTGGFLIGASGFYFEGTTQTITSSIDMGNTGNRFYRANSGVVALNEIYNGSVAQSTINGTGAVPGTGWSAWPTTGNLINNVTINNSAGVTLSTSKVVNGTLTMSGGKLAIGANTLTLNGTVTGMSASNSITGSSTSNLTIGGTGSLGTLFFDQATAGTTDNISTFTLNRTSSGAVSLGNDVRIGSSLALTNGLLTLGSANLTLASGASISGTPSVNNMIIAEGSGQLRRTYTAAGSFTFPVGDATSITEYSPVTVNVTGGSGYGASTYIGVNLSDAKHPNNASGTNFLTRSWNVTQSGITSCVATVTGTYLAADVTGTEGSIKAAQLNGTFNQSTNPWVKTGGSNLASNTLTYTGASLTSGTASVFTGITSADPSVTVSGAATVCTGGTVTLTASPTGDASFIYNWSGSLGTSQTASPSTASVGSTDYTVTVRDGNGIVATSAAATVAVVAQPSITTQPSGATICFGNSYNPTVVAAGGTPSLTYQWQYSANGTGGWNNVSNGTPANATYANATDASLFTVSGNIAAGTYYYRVVVSAIGTGCSSATSNTATLVITNTNTWAGTVSTNWNTAGNWSCNYVPTSASDVVIPSGTTFSPNITSDNAVANSITINSSATLTMSNSRTLTITASGSFNNNGTFTRGDGTVNFAGAATLSGSSVTNFNNITINTGQLTTSTVPRIHGTLRINGGNLSAAPIYESGSTLFYNVSYGRFVEWNATGVGTLGTTAGYPNNVTINTGTFNVFNNATGVARALAGTLTVNNGATFSFNAMNATFTAGNGITINSGGTLSGSTMSGQVTVTGDLTVSGTLNMNTMTKSIVVSGNVTNNGALTLSSSGGGDIKVGGNWTRGSGGTFTPNARAVFFTGSGTNVINSSGGASFDYLVSEKTSGSIQLGSNMTVNAPNTGNALSLLSAATFDLNGNTLNLTNAAASSILASDGSVQITGTGTVNISGGLKTVASSSSGTLSFGTGVTVALAGGFNPGSSLTTVNGTLQINGGGFVSANAPFYGSSSLLKYNSASLVNNAYGRGVEWSATSGAGYPNDVQISNNTAVDYPNNGGNNTVNLSIARDLIIDEGSSFFMDYGLGTSSGAVTVGRNVSISGSLSLGDGNGGNMIVGGNWTRSGTAGSFTSNSRTVVFNGSGDQTITRTGGSGTSTFAGLTVSKSGGNLILANDVTCTGTVTLTNGDIVTNANKLIISSTGDITAGTDGSHVVGNLQRHFATGSNVSRLYAIGDGTNYAPATVTLGTVNTAGTVDLRNDDGAHPNIGTYGLSATKYISRYWSASNVSAVFTNGSIAFTYKSADLEGGASSNNIRGARYTGSAWAYPETAVATNQYTVSGLNNTTLGIGHTGGECAAFPSFTVNPSNNGPLCEGSTLNLSSGTIIGGLGSYTYAWSGPNSFSSTTQSPSRTNVVAGDAGNYTLTVTDAAGCSNSGSSASTTVSISQAPTTSNAGANQTLCISAGSASLSANAPATGRGTGSWSVKAGSPSTSISQFNDPSSRTATFTPAGGAGSYVLIWTISNAPCTASTSEVTIKFDAVPDNVTAGVDQTLCNTSTFTLAGNAPTPATATGLWSVISGPGTITNASVNNTTITGVTAGSQTTLQWTVTNGVCTAVSDQVVLTNKALPTAAAAGPDQEKCNNGSFTLAGNTATSGTGTWTVHSGTATITDASSPTSTVTGVPVGTSATLRWTITNSPCTASFDDVILTNSTPPATSIAGDNQTQCNNSTFTLAGNTPSPGTGLWTIVTGSATITAPTSPTSTVTGVTAGTSVTLRWTVTNGSCSSASDVTLTNNNPPSTAAAGDDQTSCSNAAVTLAANAASGTSTGTWSILAGSPSTSTSQFSDVNSNTATFTPAGGNGVYTLRWTISAPGCSNTTDDVAITITEGPIQANAGNDQSKCDNGNFTMAANTPNSGATGTWTLVSGSADIASPNSPTSTVTLASGATATLRWTISKAPCTSTFDEVVLTYTTANTWTGSTSTAWNVGSNWSCGSVPNDGNSITIPAGLGTYPTISTEVNIKDVTINSGATLTISSGGKITFANGGTFTNNGTFNNGSGTVEFAGTGTVAGSSGVVFHNVNIAGGVNFGNAVSTVNGTLQINSGGFVNTNAPRYGSSSNLYYNTTGTYNRNIEWSASGVGTIGTTAGYPNNVTIGNNTTLALGANSGVNIERAMHGNLTIESGSTMSLTTGGNMLQPLTVRGNAVINGTLTLSGNTGGDLNVGGNMTIGTSATFSPNNRSVKFNSATANQTITKNGGGTIDFSYLNIDNTASSGKVVLASGTNLRIVSSNSNDALRVLQLTNGDLDLGVNKLTLDGSVPSSTNIQVANGIRNILGSAGSSIEFTGSATSGTPNLNVFPVNSTTDKLNITSNATLETSVGVRLTNTILNGSFQINVNGFVAGSVTADAPVYNAGSTLIYNNGAAGFNRNYEWIASSGTLGTTPGYPDDVIVKNSTVLNLGNASVSSGVAERAIAGDMTIEAGSDVRLNAMAVPLTINGNLSIAGTLTLSSEAGGNLNLAGNWSRTGAGALTQNGRNVRFFGSALQTVSRTGGETMSHVVVDKTGQKVQLVDNLTISSNLAIDNGTLDVNTAVLNVQDVVSKASTGTLMSAVTGSVLYSKPTNSQSVLAADYGNLTFSNFAKTLPSTGTIRVANEFTPGSGTGHTIAGSTIEFNGSGAQSVPEFNYNNLTISGARGNSALTLGSGTIGVAGNFTASATGVSSYVTTGNTVDFNGTTSQTISAFDFNNLRITGEKGNGTVTLGSGTIRLTGNYTVSASNVSSYITTGNTFEFTNTSAQQLITASVPVNFNNLVVNKSGQTLNASGASTINIAGNITLTAGQFIPGPAGTINMTGGNWTNNGGTFTRGNSTVVFSGTGEQVIGGSTTAAQEFANVTMNKASGTLSIAAEKQVKVNNVFTLSEGGTFAPGLGTTLEFDKSGETQSVPRANYHSLKLSNGGTKVLANEVAVAGDLIVENPTSGTTTVTPGAIIKLNGNNNQAIAGLSFRSVQISGGATKRFTSNASILGAMTFESGSGTVDLDGTSNDLLFTVRSIADSTARIANVNGWTLNGKAVVERYVPAQRKWRLISIPTVPGETLRQALTRQIDNSYPNPICVSPDQVAGSGTLLTGHSFSSCAVANSVGYDHLVNGGASSIRYYNQNASNRWASSSSTPTILAPPSESGYLVFIRGDRKATASGSNVTTLRPKGDLIQGNYPVQIKGQFFVLGNPYASPISFESLWASNQDKLLRKFWVWDANLNNSSNGVGGYRSFSYNGGPSSSYTISPPLEAGQGSLNDYLNINSSQAIMVERNGSATGDVIVQETHKVGSRGNLVNLRTSNDDALGKLEVNLYRASGSNLELLMDGVTARFANWYEAEPTDNYDMYKHNQFEENLSFLRVDANNVNRWMSIESRPMPTANDTIFMPFYQMSNRGYALKFSAENMPAANLRAFLQDQFTGTETEVPLDGSDLVYPFTVSADANSRALTRMRVVFRPSTITNTPDLFATKDISIYPNPVVKGEGINLQFRNTGTGRYTVQVYDMLGIRVHQAIVVHAGGNGIQRVQLPKGLSSGTYFVELTDQKGQTGKQKVVIQ